MKVSRRLRWKSILGRDRERRGRETFGVGTFHASDHTHEVVIRLVKLKLAILELRRAQRLLVQGSRRETPRIFSSINVVAGNSGRRGAVEIRLRRRPQNSDVFLAELKRQAARRSRNGERRHIDLIAQSRGLILPVDKPDGITESAFINDGPVFEDQIVVEDQLAALTVGGKLLRGDLHKQLRPGQKFFLVFHGEVARSLLYQSQNFDLRKCRDRRAIGILYRRRHRQHELVGRLAGGQVGRRLGDQKERRLRIACLCTGRNKERQAGNEKPDVPETGGCHRMYRLRSLSVTTSPSLLRT